jgi:hypothetical protein
MKPTLAQKIGVFAVSVGVLRVLITAFGNFTDTQRKREYVKAGALITAGMAPFIYTK